MGNVFERVQLNGLRNWRKSEYRKPLVVRGARQVGKTTVIKSFGKEFENFLYVNLEDRELLKIFEREDNLINLVSLLFVYLGVQRKEGDTLLFIDEIQESPAAVAKMRYFYESMPELFVVSAGSLLETKVDFKVSFPVGRVQYMAVRPCSFIEYLNAIGKRAWADCLKDTSLAKSLHTTLMNEFNRYVLVGGMPEAVKRYAETLDIKTLDSVYETLVTSYSDDVEKYVKGKSLTNIVKHILEYGWGLAGQCVTLSNFAGSSYKAREVGEAMLMLQKAMLLETVYPSTATQIPALPDMKRHPKLLWLDTGLVNFKAGIQKEK